MKDNIKTSLSENKFYRIYLAGFFLILALPLLAGPLFFSPPDWGKTTVFRSILAILIFLFIYQFSSPEGRARISVFAEVLKQRKNRAFLSLWLLVAVFGWFLLTTIFSQDINFSLWGSPYRAGGFVNFAFYIIFALLTFLIIKPKGWQKIWNFSFCVGILVSLIAVFQYFKVFKKVFVSFEEAPPSTTGNSTFLSIYLLLLSFIAIAYFIKEKWGTRKVFYLLAFLFFVFVILIANSRAAYLGMAAGSLYFILFYPSKNKKITYLKIATAILLFLAVIGIYYLNTTSKAPEFIQKNRVLSTITYRLSYKLVLEESRFSAWKIAWEALKERPIFGWGPENFQIGFDKYYDPSLPEMPQLWWDRAHNVLLDIGVTAGIPAVLIYLLFFGVLFWKLQKTKYSSPPETNNIKHPLLVHGTQTAILGYFAANLFSFDSITTYLTIFLIIGHSFSLIYEPCEQKIEQKSSLKWLYKARIPLSAILLVGLICFLWNYNIKPAQVNTQINKAENLVKIKKCNEGLSKIDNVLSEKSFVDAFLRLKYIEFMKKCIIYYPEKNLEYAKKGTEILKYNIEIQSKYLRTWILLGSFTNVLAGGEKDTAKRQKLTEEAEYYFKKAQELSPKRQEILIEWTKVYLVSEDYRKMKEKSEECLKINQSMAGCYWYLGLSQIFLGKEAQAKENLTIAREKGHPFSTLTSLNQLNLAYTKTRNYKELVAVYSELIGLKPKEPQYRASLAFCYRELGNYPAAREQALIFEQLMPEAKKEVEIFLKSLQR